MISFYDIPWGSRSGASAQNADIRVRSNEDDAALVRDSLSGNEDAFAALVHRYLPAVYAFAYHYMGNGDDANDVTQEAFLKIWKHLKSFDQKKNFKTWALTIAKNTALDVLKKKRPIVFSKIEAGDGDLDAFLAPHMGTGESPDDAFQRTEMKTTLDAALMRLAPAYRVVLSLRYEEGLKFREIAEILNEPIDTVKSKHRRGLIMLRSFVAR